MYAKGVFSMCMQMIRPVLWLLERCHHPYFLVYTNTRGSLILQMERDNALCQVRQYAAFSECPCFACSAETKR